MPYYAHVVNVRTEIKSARPFDSAEQAARNLAMLLRLDGWQAERDATVARLITGETISHRNFSYRVSQEP
jgi:hypothetical protein